MAPVVAPQVRYEWALLAHWALGRDISESSVSPLTSDSTDDWQTTGPLGMEGS